MSTYETMGKAELRNACKAAGIKYSNMTNETMRTALNKHEANNAPTQVQSVQQPAVSAEPVVTTPPAAEAPTAPAPAEQPKAAPVPKDSRNGMTKPKAGSICASIWDACNAIVAAGEKVTFAALKEKLPNVNDSTIRTQAQRHRTYGKDVAK